MRSLIRIALESDGCEVIEAHDGAELLGLLKRTVERPRSRPDVVITDIRMPNFSGLGVLRTLRQAHRSLPVILITADSSPAIRSDATQWGACAVIAKPFEMDELRAAVIKAQRSRGV